MKNPVLSEPDRRAVDLLLNHAATVSSTGHSEPVSPKRLNAVQKMLGNLDKMTTDEPTAGLVQRTMARIDRAVEMPTQAAAVATTVAN